MKAEYEILDCGGNCIHTVVADVPVNDNDRIAGEIAVLRLFKHDLAECCPICGRIAYSVRFVKGIA